MKAYVNSVGIIFSTIGALLVWHFLTELNFADKEAYIRGEGSLVIPSPNDKDIKRFKRSVFLSKMGLGFIIIGGILQILSNHFFD